MKIGRGSRSLEVSLVENSPLRHADPRSKLLLSVIVSLAVMMSLERLALFILLYIVFLLWARLLPSAVRQIWRIKWMLLALFAVDWWLISVEHAITICIRLVLLSAVFSTFFSTTNTRELGLALERLGVPYRYAFSLSLAFQSLGMFDNEWRAIREAQASRGIRPELSSIRRFFAQVGDLVSLTVPAIVLATKRAWGITEAAYARGFDSPHRSSYHRLAFNWLDVVLLAAAGILLVIIIFWR